VARKGQAALEFAVDAVNGALDAHADPLVQGNVTHQAIVLLGGVQACCGNELVGTVFVQSGCALCNCTRTPEFFCGFTRMGTCLALLQHLHRQDVPASHAHDGQDQQYALGNAVGPAPQGGNAVGVLCSGSSFRLLGSSRVGCNRCGSGSRYRRGSLRDCGRRNACNSGKRKSDGQRP
jgi:hypothetical protein